MVTPIISIITPSFNQVQFLEQTILSVINQNYPNLEYIIIDGGSTDGSVEIIKKYENYLAYWISENDRGQSEAINKGLKKATGEIVAWLNSDDLYLPETLSTVAKTFSENSDVYLIYGNVENFYIDGKSKTIENNFSPVDFLSRVSIHQPSVFWRRKLHKEIGYLDETLHYCMDYDLWMKVFFNYKTLKINKTLSRFRVHNQAKSSGNPKNLYLEYRTVVSRFINSVDQSSKEHLTRFNIYSNRENKKYNITNAVSKKELKTIVNNYIWNCAIQEYTWGNKKNANKLFSYCIKFKPVKSLFFLAKNNLCTQKCPLSFP